MARTKLGNRNKRRPTKSQPKVILCSVCGKGDAKYKCPKCRAPFCCVQCSKDHKANHCTAATPTKIITSSDDAPNASTNGEGEQSNYLPKKELMKTTTQKKKKRRRQSDNDDSDDSHDDEPGWNITPEMKKRVRESTWLRKELQDGGLRQLISRIDAASEDEDDDDDDNEGNDTYNNRRQKYNTRRGDANTSGSVSISPRGLALARTKHSHSKFAMFVDQIMLTAGVLHQQPDPGATNNGGLGGGQDINNALVSILEGRGHHAPLVLTPVPRVGARKMESEDDSESSSDGESSSSSESDESSEDDDSS